MFIRILLNLFLIVLSPPSAIIAVQVIRDEVEVDSEAELSFIQDLIGTGISETVSTLRTKHHDTRGEACCQCKSSSKSESSCWAGSCGDGTGKFCWNTSATGSFTQCASTDFSGCAR